jgi:hypothetical protein
VRSRTEVAEFCRAWFHERFTIVHQTVDGEFVIDQTGTGYCCYDRSYVRNSAGTLLIDEPDCVYGHWVSNAYREVASVGTPQCDEVSARIKRPRRQEIEVEYRRVIVPFVTSDSGDFMVSASLLQRCVQSTVECVTNRDGSNAIRRKPATLRRPSNTQGIVL